MILLINLALLLRFAKIHRSELMTGVMSSNTTAGEIFLSPRFVQIPCLGG